MPFKLFTITSGIINFNIFIFFFTCLIARGLRFFIVAFLSAKFGKTFGLFMEKKGAKWLTDRRMQSLHSLGILEKKKILRNFCGS